VNSIDVKDLVRKRFGAKVARDRFRPVSAEGLRPTGPLELFQIDHTLIDVIAVDEMDRLAIGRPWLTLVIDVATRMIAGYYLSFDHPSAASVALAIAHAVLPKEKYLRDLGIDAEWPVQGLPKVIHLDNAEEFHSRALERGSQEHGIELKYRPPLSPHCGGHIERLIGTLMGAVHLLPGTTFSSIKDRGDYDSQGKSVMTVHELELWFALQVSGVYHHGFHRSLGKKPIDAWNKGIGSSMSDMRRMPSDFISIFFRMSID
jgi:putative transposase